MCLERGADLHMATWARERHTISSLRFLAECHKRRLNPVVLFCCLLGCLLFLICIEFVYVYFPVLFLLLSISQLIGCEDRLGNDLDCVEWGVKLYSNSISMHMAQLMPLPLTVFCFDKIQIGFAFLVWSWQIMFHCCIYCLLDFTVAFSVPWCCWLGDRKGIQPVKNWVVGCWRGYLSGARCRLAYAQLMPLPLTVSCFSKIQIGCTFLVPAHPGSPGKRAVKRMCVCVTFTAYDHVLAFQL